MSTEIGSTVKLANHAGRFSGAAVKVIGVALDDGSIPVRTRCGSAFLVTPQELGIRPRRARQEQPPQVNRLLSSDVLAHVVPKGWKRDGDEPIDVEKALRDMQ